jgi:dipeptidyl aminopeptidase/acylaminoacyl peptidase
MIDLGVLLRVPCVETEMGFDVSPDGKRVAFSWNRTGQWEIFELDLDQPGDRVPVRLTLAPGGKFHPRYSPDGRKLAFACDPDGGEYFQIHVLDLDEKTEIVCNTGVRASIQPFFSWSPDGDRIAYISDASGEFSVYTTSFSRDEEPQLIFDPGFPAWKVFWSPDGTHLAVVSEASAQDYGLHIFDLTQGSAVRLEWAGVAINAKDPAWSPDGCSLAFASDVDDNYQIGIWKMATGGIEWLTTGEGQKQVPRWSSDDGRLVYTFTLGTLSWVALQEPGTEPRLTQVEPGVHYQPCFLPGGRGILFLFDNPRNPTDLWFLGEAEKPERITHSRPLDLKEEVFVLPGEIRYSGLDGAPVPALLFDPGGSKADRPAVILVHGGPDWHFEATWYPLMVHMASRGWVVLVPNYRGSTGYGHAWQTASRFDYGGVDAGDVIAGAHHLIREQLADPRRIAVTGRSHGGYLTACCLTRAPELWAAGSAVVPFLDWFANHEDIRPDLKHWDLENFGDPVRDHDRWFERSPSNFLDRVQAPLQLICGRNDARCPVRDSVSAYEQLRKMGKPVELLIFEDEGHSFLKLDNIIRAESRRVDFLAEALGRKTGGSAI